MFTHSSKIDSNKKQVVSANPKNAQGVLGAPSFSVSSQNVMQPQHTMGNSGVLQLIQSQSTQRPAGLPIQRTVAGSDTSSNALATHFRIPDQFRDQVQKKNVSKMGQHENNTGMPDTLKAGVENLSGLPMDDVRVHYNSDKPAQVGALAYTKGTDIHVASGQEMHLPHEAWHVVQQKQCRVRPTMQLKNVRVNDDGGLEREADVMGGMAKDFCFKGKSCLTSSHNISSVDNGTIQRKVEIMQADGITELMIERWGKATKQFKGIVEASTLATGDTNQVVLYGVSQRTHPEIKNDYGSTSLYIGDDGYKGSEFDKFSEIWQQDVKKVTEDVSVRVVITINLTINKTEAELYATLLHEWLVHASKWDGVLKEIRDGNAGTELPRVKGQGAEKREDSEHAKYANMKDDEIEAYVKSLKLSEKGVFLSVFKKMKSDRDRYDKSTGKLIQ